VSGTGQLFVYYRIRADATTEAARRVAALFDALAAEGLPLGRLLRRRDEALLWMEVYEPVLDCGWAAERIEALAGHFRFAEVLMPGGIRKVECFEDAPPCA
jgi:hypothetical protein